MGEESGAAGPCELCGGSGWQPGRMGVLPCDHRSELEQRLALDDVLDYLGAVDPGAGVDG